MAGYDNLLTAIAGEAEATAAPELSYKVPSIALKKPVPVLSAAKDVSKRVPLSSLPAEKTGGYDDLIEAFAAGYLNLLPFGEKLTKDNRAARENPLAEVAGGVVGSIPTFGVIGKLPVFQAVDKALEAAPTATKVLGKTLKGAAEMGLFQTATEATKEKPLAEKAQAVREAMGVGGAFGLIPELPGVAKRFVSSYLPESATKSLSAAAKKTVLLSPDALIGKISLKEAGERIVAGDKTVLPEIAAGVKEYGSATVKDNLINKGIMPALKKQAEKVGFAKAEEGIKALSNDFFKVLEPAARSANLEPVGVGFKESFLDDIVSNKLFKGEIQGKKYWISPDGKMEQVFDHIEGAGGSKAAEERLGQGWAKLNVSPYGIMFENKQASSLVDLPSAQRAYVERQIEDGVPILADFKNGFDVLKKASPSSLGIVPEEVSFSMNKKPGQSGEGPIRPRSFTETVKESGFTDPKLLAKLETDLYGQRNTAVAMTKARLMVKNYPNHAKAFFAKPGLDDAKAFVGQELIKDAQAKGNFDEAVVLVKDLSGRATESGRFSQALSAYNRLTPDGILRYAQNIVDEANRLRPDLNLFLSPDKARAFVSKATDIAKMADGKEKEMATRELLKMISEVVPPTLARKLSTIQTISQLLNPKTLIRNVVGNTLFSGLENINQALVARPLDKLLALATGKRTTLAPSLKTQVKGFVSGFKEGAEASKKGLNFDLGTRFDLPTVATFREGILGKLEQAMNIALRAPDRAAYKAAFDDSIRQQLRIAGVKEATSEMIEQAHLSGLYRTFQDDNVVSLFFSKLKKNLNIIGLGQGTDHFGLGDLILKYPKTPANLLARAYDYSPLGLFSAGKEAVTPLIGKEFNQKAFVDSFSRAITGTTGLGLSAVLARLGILNPSEQMGKNKKLVAFQRMQGLSNYQVNVSALKRLILSGFNAEAGKLRPGDTLVTYDWAQPVSVNLAMGSKLAESKSLKEGALSLLDIIESGTTTLADQPLLTGVKNFFGGFQSLPQSFARTAISGPASFVPTLFNQVATMVDPGLKLSATPELSGAKEALNRALVKIPFVKSLLAKRYDVFGQEAQGYQGKPTIKDVFFNPAFVTKYAPNKEAQELMRLFYSTGETKQLPAVPGSKLTIYNQTILLTDKELSRYQKLAGAVSYAYLTKLVALPGYAGLSDDQKVKEISNVMSAINQAAKTRIVAERFHQKTKGLTKEQKISFLKKQQEKGLLTNEVFKDYLQLNNK